MSVIATVLFVLNALLLVGVVLIQQPKTSGGLFSGTGQSLLGTSGKSFWTKFTTILAGTFMVLCLLMWYLGNHSSQAPSSVTDLIEKQQQQQAAPPAQAAVTNSNQKPTNPQPQGNPAPQGQPMPNSAPSVPGNLTK
jgi:preprotein translocase subunit SecG